MCLIKTARALLLVGSLGLAGCQSTPTQTEPNFDRPLDAAASAYRDYEQGDCDRVGQISSTESLREWQSTEIRHSMVLVRGFCEERAGNLEAARQTYRELVRDAPLSFASDDARERLRVLRLTDKDPDYKAWVEAAGDRHLERGKMRVPVDRIPAAFPPLAHHAEIGGFAVVEFGVTPGGDTDSPIIVDSSPPLLFDGAALRAVREWRYTPDANLKESQRQIIRIVFQPADAESTIEDTTATAVPSGP